MNAVPNTAANTIESTTKNVSVLKMPVSSAPPLLNIPPPIPLQWQLAVPSRFISSEIERSTSIAPQITVKKENISPTISVAEVSRILKQFGRLNDYDSWSNLLIDAFIKDLQCGISSIIPCEITDLCATFYYTKESKYIHFAYKLYIVLRKKENMENVSGKQLVSIIMNDIDLQCVKSYNDIIQLCSALLEHNLLELSWYKTTFSSLFDEPQTNKTSFKDSDDYVYSFTNLIIQASESHISALTSANVDCET